MNRPAPVMDVRPDYASFASEYRQGRSQVLWTTLVADLDTPVSAMLKLAWDRPNSFLLESVEGGAIRGRYSFIGRDPDLIWRCRGNAAEIAALAYGEAIDALARRLGTVVARTGESDHVTDGRGVRSVANGHPLMAKVTAMGCAGAAITTAFLTCEGEAAESVAAALLALGIAGEAAGVEARGPGSFAAAYLDALHGLDALELATRARLGPDMGETSP